MSLTQQQSSAPNSAERRLRMVQTQLVDRGLSDPRVIAAMSEVPREAFLAPELREFAYSDCPQPIGFGQTMSQPWTVAYQCEALALRDDEIVLEIGTGSGYGAAVLSRLAKTVYSIERVPALAERAKQTLQRLGYDNVHVRIGDGTLGLPEGSPFDAILVTAGAPTLPPAYTSQLTENGRIVIPLGEHPYNQILTRITRHNGEWRCQALGGYAFVPLVGEQGWNERSIEAALF